MTEHTSDSPKDNRLDIHIFSDLFQRSRVSVLAYFFLFWALVFLTPIFREQRTMALSLGSIVTLVVGVRFYLAVTFTPERFSRNPDSWKRLFLVLVLLSALLWGLLNVLISSSFGVLSWAGVYCLIMTCGILAGGANSLAPHRKAMVGFIFFILGPYVIWAFFEGEITLAVFLIVFIALFVSVAKESNKFYIANLDTRMTVSRQSEKLAETVHAIKSGSENLKASSEGLNDISRALKTSSEDMSSHIGDIENLSATLKTNAWNIAESVEKTAGNVASVTGAIDNINASIDQASRETDQVMSVTAEAVDQALVASEKIDVLKQAAQEIGKITEMISDISDQTNLLALNATIEAARAGEAGKGFAVVATEIKELARQTANATAQIKNEVEGIQNSTESSALEVKDISQVISSVKDKVGLLAEAVREQGVMSEEIVHEINEMSGNMTAISDQIASNTTLVQDMEGIITQTRSLTDQVMDLGAQSNENAEGLLSMARNLSQLSDMAANGKKS